MKCKTNVIRFDMIGACNLGVTGHPQKILSDLGIVCASSNTSTLSDSWVFKGCVGVPNVLPEYMEVI